MRAGGVPVLTGGADGRIQYGGMLVGCGNDGSGYHYLTAYRARNAGAFAGGAAGGRNGILDNQAVFSALAIESAVYGGKLEIAGCEKQNSGCADDTKNTS